VIAHLKTPHLPSIAKGRKQNTGIYTAKRTFWGLLSLFTSVSKCVLYFL
jgi:hypothetical protein